jgi:DNA-binding LytR/AlgR family response regulator
MKIVIVEDEPLAAQDLQKRIQSIQPDAVIVGIISSVSAAKKWFTTNAHPDLVFSDIQLSDGNSFEIYESIDLACPIIFTTAFDSYAIRAFKLNSIDYLLKPVDEKELAAALKKYKALNPDSLVGEQLKRMLTTWGESSRMFKERFLALHKNTLVPVTVGEIAYIHKDELIYIQTMANEKLISEHHTLDEVETLLDPKIFYRVNRQYIVHIQVVGKIKPTHKGLTVQLKPPFNLEIDISREKATAFKEWIG